MTMSRIRDQFPRTDPAAPLASAPMGDLDPFVVFTQLRANGPFLYAGWLEAPDPEMALLLARDHYGRDQVCTAVRVIHRADLESSDGLYTLALPPSDGTEWLVATQKRPGDIFIEMGRVRAAGPAAAMDAARASVPGAGTAHVIWVIPADRAVTTAPDDLIWRTTDQTYRLARGYRRDVREKWTRFRDESALADYERDDLTEEF